MVKCTHSVNPPKFYMEYDVHIKLRGDISRNYEWTTIPIPNDLDVALENIADALSRKDKDPSLSQ